MEKDELVIILKEFDLRLRKIEDSVSMGRGAFGMFLAVIGLIGAITGIFKILGK